MKKLIQLSVLFCFWCSIAFAQIPPALPLETLDLASQISPTIPTVIQDTKTVTVYDTLRVQVFDTISSAEETERITDTMPKAVVEDAVKEDDTEEEDEGTLDKALNPVKDIVNKGKSSAPPSISEVINFSNIFWSLIILIFSYFVIKILVQIVERFAERSTNYRIGLKSLSPFIRIIGWLVAIIWVVEGIFQPSNEKLFAFIASAGIAIGFAAQDILKNIFGGIMILFDQPFQVGDKIEVGSYYGEVKAIGLRSTRIETKDDSLVSVPNAEVVNSAVSNSNVGEANCQVVAEIYLPIDTDTNRARQIATEAAQVSKFIYLNKPITVLFFNEVKEQRSYLKMRLKAYVSDIRNEFDFQSDMTEIVIQEFVKQEIITIEEVS